MLVTPAEIVLTEAVRPESALTLVVSPWTAVLMLEKPVDKVPRVVEIPLRVVWIDASAAASLLGTVVVTVAVETAVVTVVVTVVVEPPPMLPAL